MWPPRSGRSHVYRLWKYDVEGRLADLNIESIDEALELEAPSDDALAQHAEESGAQRVTRSTNPVELFAQALEEYQVLNGYIFDIVHQSILIAGPHEEDDMATVRSFRKGKLKNGVGLLTWALTWTDVSSFETQSSLRTRLDKASVPTNPSCLSLFKFLTSLLEVWKSISGNSVKEASSLALFYVELQRKLPSKTDGGYLVLVRQWLVVKRLERNPILDTPKVAIETMVLYAKEQGMPTNGYGDEFKHGFECDEGDTSLMAVGDDGGDTAGRRGGFGGGKGDPNRDRHDRPKYGPETNECQNCDSFFCFPKNRGSADGKCICCPESKFDLKKEEYGIAAGGRRYVYVSRAWNRLNPGKKLKGLNFKTVKDTVKEHDDKSGGHHTVCWQRTKITTRRWASRRPLKSMGLTLARTTRRCSRSIISLSDVTGSMIRTPSTSGSIG